jgi:hypothetical protein
MLRASDNRIGNSEVPNSPLKSLVFAPLIKQASQALRINSGLAASAGTCRVSAKKFSIITEDINSASGLAKQKAQVAMRWQHPLARVAK